jgi:hypothetical protein
MPSLQNSFRPNKRQQQSLKMKKFNRVCEWLRPDESNLLLAFVFSVTMFVSCSEKKISDEQGGDKEPIPDSVYAQQGNRIVALSFDTLRNSLLHAIGSSSIEEAIAFCNEKAFPITATYTDSIDIRRTSLRIRNPKNKPDSLELLVLNEMEGLMKSGKVPNSKVVRHTSTGELHFFKPILLQAMCLNCHGTPGLQIQNTTLARIHKLYPDDQAVNFKEGDLRGLWHIIFNIQKKK